MERPTSEGEGKEANLLTKMIILKRFEINPNETPFSPEKKKKTKKQNETCSTALSKGTVAKDSSPIFLQRSSWERQKKQNEKNLGVFPRRKP